MIITFETAKLAKVKGVQIGIEIDAYALTDVFNYKRGELIPLYFEEPADVALMRDKIAEACSQDILCGILRNNYNIFININRHSIGSDEWVFGYYIEYLPKKHWQAKRRSSKFEYIEDKFYIGYGTYGNAWDTYEEALENALVKSLTLIENEEEAQELIKTN